MTKTTPSLLTQPLPMLLTECRRPGRYHRCKIPSRFGPSRRQDRGPARAAAGRANRGREAAEWPGADAKLLAGTALALSPFLCRCASASVCMIVCAANFRLITLCAGGRAADGADESPGDETIGARGACGHAATRDGDHARAVQGGIDGLLRAAAAARGETTPRDFLN